MKVVEVSSVLVAVKVRLLEVSKMLVAESSISVGALLFAAEVAAVETASASVSVIYAAPDPADAFSAVAAALT